MTKRYLVLLTWLTAGLCSPCLAQRVGPEFQVNTFTRGNQFSSAVASDARGRFVVVWTSWQPDTLNHVFGQRYDSAGNRSGAEFQVNTYTPSEQGYPAIASGASGNFVVTWQSYGQDGSRWGVFGQRYASDGSPLGGEFQVNTYTTDIQRDPQIASNANDGFVVVWTSYEQDGFTGGIFAQRYDNAGNRIGNEFRVNAYATGRQYRPSVDSDANGNFVVVWNDGSFFDPQEDGLDGSSTGVFGQRFDSEGHPLGGEFQVNTYTTGYQGQPSVASDPHGNFVVAWEDGDVTSDGDGQDGSDSGIFGRRYDRDGNALGGEFQINTYTKGPQSLDDGAVASDANGNFVVVWHGRGEGGDHDKLNLGVLGQRFDSGGNRQRGEFRVNTYTPWDQWFASVSSDPAGNFVVVWGDGSQQDGSLSGVFGQRFSAACEASVQVQGDVHAPGSMIPVRVHIAHHRPKTVTVPWELRLRNNNGQRIVRRVTEPHTFEPGDVVDRDVQFQLPDDLANGTYTLELAITGMAGTKGATMALRVVRAE